MIRGFHFEDKDNVAYYIKKLVEELWIEHNVEKMNETDRKIFAKDLETLVNSYFKGTVIYLLASVKEFEMNNLNEKRMCQNE